jgi:thiamine-phosphate pyrophosphorylase
VYDLTPAASRALNLAEQERDITARALQLLRILVADEDGLAFQLLIRAGTNVEKLREALGTDSIPVTEAMPELRQDEPASASFGPILREARSLAHEMSGESTIATDHLLLGVLHFDRQLADMLAQHGFDARHLEPSGPKILIESALDLTEPTVIEESTRLLDANFNRCREALRVVEDYCRFVLNDRVLCSELKQLRHDVAGLAAQIPIQHYIAARDSEQDVGATVSTRSEVERSSARAVVEANLKRLQESLRSLEEFGKIYSPYLGEAIERIRYRTYTLEKAILLIVQARQRLAGVHLYVLVSGPACTAALDWTIAEAAAGGAEMVQLREKKLDDRALLERARQVRQWTEKAGLLFIMNDRPDIARLARADGVHLGQDDMPVSDARHILGPDALIGVSTHNLGQVRQAVLDGASYIGVGPTFPSGTKEFASLAGLEFMQAALHETSLPAFVIGGVNQETVAAAVAAGARRVAVCQTVCAAEDPRSAAADLHRCLVAAKTTNGG